VPDAPPPRKRGRPPLYPAEKRSVAVSVRLSEKQYDALYLRARQARCSVAELVRAELHAHRHPTDG